VGMFGMPDVDFIDSTTNAFQGDQIRGYGFLHDGSVDTIFNFFRASVFPGINDGQRADMEQFVLAFDSDLAPVVGQQVTLDAGNGADANPRIDLLIERAEAGFVSKILGGNTTECDLVVKGRVGGEDRGWLYDPGSGLFDSDRASEAALSDAALRALAQTAGQELTYTCVPPGTGMRVALDRDEDGGELDDAPVVEPLDLGEAGDVGDARSAAHVDEDRFAGDGLITDGDLLLVHKVPPVVEQRHRIFGLQPVAQAVAAVVANGVHARHHTLEVNFNWAGLHAVFRGRAGAVSGLGAGDERFRRGAPHVDTRAADGAAFDDGDRAAAPQQIADEGARSLSGAEEDIVKCARRHNK